MLRELVSAWVYENDVPKRRFTTQQVRAHMSGVLGLKETDGSKTAPDGRMRWRGVRLTQAGFQLHAEHLMRANLQDKAKAAEIVARAK
jgi:hypothetical protein